MFDNEEFDELFEQDPIDEIRLQDLYQEQVRISMEYAWSTIESTSIDVWVRSLPISSDRKQTILQNMMDWFEEREEYEKCIILKRGFRFIDEISSTSVD
jgi:hypothetical protein